MISPPLLKGQKMQGAYGGLICILIYGTGEVTVEEELALLTQDNVFILTQSSDLILATEDG